MDWCRIAVSLFKIKRRTLVKFYCYLGILSAARRLKHSEPEVTEETRRK
jgi:hypothetical protein